MMNVTQDDLLQYMYKECTPEKFRLLHQLLLSNEELQERLNILYAVKSKLDKIKLISPDERSVDNILNYSKQGVEIYL